MTYRAFVRANARFLAFGFALCFFSSFGQTFFIGVFGGVVRNEFALTHGDYGQLYSLATLASACCLVPVGRMIDRFDLRAYSAAVGVGLALSALLAANASSVWTLGIALFALRLFGQGLMGHTALTSMARYFDANRAKAVSLASLGFAVGEAVWPRAAIAILDDLGWRQTWLAIAALLAAVLVPLVQWLLSGHARRHSEHLAAVAPVAGPSEAAQRHWTRAEVLRDPRFYMRLPAVVAPPMIVTGMFFHSVHIAATQGWTMAWYGNCFVAFALVQLASALWAGPVVDRRGAGGLLAWTLVPMIGGLAAIVASGGAGACAFYLVALGVTAGVGSTTVGALWAEAYGVRHLGSIRAMTSAAMVLSTALAPALMGWLLDADVIVEAIAVGWMGFAAVAIALALVAGRHRRAGPGSTLTNARES